MQVRNKYGLNQTKMAQLSLLIERESSDADKKFLLKAESFLKNTLFEDYNNLNNQQKTYLGSIITKLKVKGIF